MDDEEDIEFRDKARIALAGMTREEVAELIEICSPTKTPFFDKVCQDFDPYEWPKVNIKQRTEQ